MSIGVAGLVAIAWQDLIARCFPVQRRGRFMGISFFVGGLAGALAAGVIGGYLADRLGRKATLVISSFGAAVAMLLDSGEAGFDALVAPGHVATVMGPEEWQFVVTRHNMPAAIGIPSTL